MGTGNFLAARMLKKHKTETVFYRSVRKLRKWDGVRVYGLVCLRTGVGLGVLVFYPRRK
jgi:hypothetical protein